MQRHLGRKLGISLSGDFVTQSESDADQQDVSALRTSLSLVFHPIVRSR